MSMFAMGCPDVIQIIQLCGGKPTEGSSYHELIRGYSIACIDVLVSRLLVDICRHSFSRD